MTEIKIHDVFHDRHNKHIGDLEEKIQKDVDGRDLSINVDNVQIASGSQNSPIYISVRDRSLSLKKIKSIARYALESFSRRVDGVNVDKRIKDRNIRIVDR